MLVVLYRATWLVPRNFPGRHQWARLWYQDTWMDHNKFTGTYTLLATRHRASNIAAVPYHISYTLTHIRGPADLGVWTLTYHARHFAIRDTKRPTNQGRFALLVAYLATRKGEIGLLSHTWVITVPGTTVPGTPTTKYCIQTACQRSTYPNSCSCSLHNIFNI